MIEEEMMKTVYVSIRCHLAQKIYVTCIFFVVKQNDFFDKPTHHFL